MCMRAEIVAILLALVGVPVGAGAFAQDGHHGQGHAENHDWYQGLRQPDTGASCCNGSANGVEGDCRPTRAYIGDDGVWRALIEGRWIVVPPRVVLQNLAPDGNSHICAGKSGAIYCFIGGSPKG